MSWRRAYLKQSESDFDMFQFLNKSKQPFCHALHYLQMATEKLAKSFLASHASPPSKRTHYALVRFLKLSKADQVIRNGLGYEKNYNAYASYIDSLMKIAEKVERLAPVGADYDTLNPEYPWRDASGEVQCPCSYEFSEFPVTEIAKISRLVSNLYRVGRSFA
jgi:hypothetical protein